ncbi:MAG: hypothetical protein H6660_05325 [Ardenticatenaceae bacterium]|nr:hypothetical protein [Ardenticatenaceae bacterium]
MTIYTYTTIIQSQTRLRRERLLPQRGEVIVSPGQEVQPVQVVARTQQATRFRIVPASELWGISPDEVSKHMVVSMGQEVQAGEPLLHRKRALGKQVLESPVEGTFYGLNNGRIILQQHEWFELRALVRARVVNAIPNRGIVLEVIGTQIQGVWGNGKESNGKLKIISDAESEQLTQEQIKEEIEGNVAVVAVLSQPELLTSLQRAGASGLIVGSISAESLPWAQKAPFPIIVTDGIGKQGMARHIFFLIRKHAEGDVALFAREPDYWGNRPELIIPHEISTGMLQSPPEYQPLAAEQMVRILRAPYTGQTGQVVRLNHYRKRTETGIVAYGADVKLADGTVVFVPYANLDTII